MLGDKVDHLLEAPAGLKVWIVAELFEYECRGPYPVLAIGLKDASDDERDKFILVPETYTSFLVLLETGALWVREHEVYSDSERAHQAEVFHDEERMRIWRKEHEAEGSGWRRSCRSTR